MTDIVQDSLLAFMRDMRIDREELVLLRRLYDATLSALNDGTIDNKTKVERILDALPDWIVASELRRSQREIELSPPVEGFNP